MGGMLITCYVAVDLIMLHNLSQQQPRPKNQERVAARIDPALGVEVDRASNYDHGGTNPGIDAAFSHADLAYRNERRTRCAAVGESNVGSKRLACVMGVGREHAFQRGRRC